MRDVFVSYASPDGQVAESLCTALESRAISCWIAPRDIPGGSDWAAAIVDAIEGCQLVLVLVSAAAQIADGVLREVDCASRRNLRIVPVRLDDAALSGPLEFYLGKAQWIDADEAAPDHGAAAVAEAVGRWLGLPATAAPPPPAAGPSLGMPGGAVPIGSELYLVRPTDDDFLAAIARRDTIVLVKGARQTGKTSLLARGLQAARALGYRVVFTDLQKLNASHFESLDRLYLALGGMLADQLDLGVLPQDAWDPRRGPNVGFERFLRRELLARLEGPLIWGLDEVDRLFSCPFSGEIFGLFRSWHNERALAPDGPWSRLTLAIAYATEAHLFISDVHQSPFNVGTRLALSDFSLVEVAELNRRYGSPLPDANAVERFHWFLGGQPYLTQRGLHGMVAHRLSLAALEHEGRRDEGIFSDHLRRLLVLLTQDPALTAQLRALLRGAGRPDANAFYRLRSAGLLAGDGPHDARPRCQLYASYLEHHLF